MTTGGRLQGFVCVCDAGGRILRADNYPADTGLGPRAGAALADYAAGADRRTVEALLAAIVKGAAPVGWRARLDFGAGATRYHLAGGAVADGCVVAGAAADAGTARALHLRALAPLSPADPGSERTSPDVSVDATAFAELSRLNNELVNARRELARQVAQVERLNERQAAVFTAMDEGVLMQARSGQVLLHNESLLRILGLAAEELAYWRSSDPRWDLLDAGGASLAGEGNPVRAVLASGQALSVAGARVCRPDGTETWITLEVRPLFQGGRDRLYAAVAVLSDVTERRRLEEGLRRQASHDELTGLHNRRHLMERLEQEVAAAARYRAALSVCVCDLDRFKAINDGHGHQSGDLALQLFADCLRAEVREVDLPARLGGDEFCIVFPHTGAAAAAACAERIRARLARTPLRAADGTRLHFGATFGVAQLGAGADAAALLASADRALYSAKAAGRGRVAIDDARPASGCVS